MTTIGERDGGEVRIFTFKEGLLSAVAHDLEIACDRFSLTWDDARAKVSGEFDAASLRVLHPVVDGRPAPGVLSSRDLAKIERNIGHDVLGAHSQSRVRFESSSVTSRGEGFLVVGTLTLAGHANELRAEVRRQGARYVTEVAIDQRRFGITPYSAMMGTLKIKPEIRVRVSVPAPPG